MQKSENLDWKSAANLDQKYVDTCQLIFGLLSTVFPFFSKSIQKSETLSKPWFLSNVHF